MTPETLQELLNIHYFHSDNLGKIRIIAGTLSSHGYPSQIREFKQLLESYAVKPNAVITAEVINILERHAARRLDPATQSSRACVEIAKEVLDSAPVMILKIGIVIVL